MQKLSVHPDATVVQQVTNTVLHVECRYISCTVRLRLRLDRERVKHPACRFSVETARWSSLGKMRGTGVLLRAPGLRNPDQRVAKDK